ncbi:VOC family protein [Agreia sp. Leaf210]|jgi:catechol-2,3-dioxygenase|uniref:VOC family protein n=1 Tax=Agreia sp. Leaf210 TaxID=1735682 RepID=UPI0006F37623|nr:VOC family protein [Agreia sp. Leaf210]KQM60863.1 hypothetical protein ASE64_04290 [Agreia sp. Leaf210]
MLKDHPVDVVLLSKDLDASREFYEKRLGLDVIEATDTAITYASGNTRLKVTASTVGTKDEQTQAEWRVLDLRAELEELKHRGVEPENYDTDELKTVDGIADQGDAWVAYLIDPDGNALGIGQAK